MYILVPEHMCVCPLHAAVCRARRRCRICWNWNYRWWASCLIGVVGTEPRCFARAARALNDWAIFQPPEKVLNGMTLWTEVLEASETMIKVTTDLLSGEG